MANNKSREEIYLELIPLIDQSFVFTGVWAVKKIDDVLNVVFKEYYKRNLSVWLENETLQNDLATFYLMFKRPFTVVILFDRENTVKYDSIAVRSVFIECKLNVIRELNIKLSDKRISELNTLFMLTQKVDNKINNNYFEVQELF